MRTKYITSLSILTVILAFSTMAFRMQGNPIMGKWQVNAKIEQKIQNGTLVESSEKNYKAGKKSFEFAADNKLIILDDYGKVKEKKKYVIEGMTVYIGKTKTPDNLYTCTYSGSQKLILMRTKTKTKEGKTTVETDELRLEKIN